MKELLKKYSSVYYHHFRVRMIASDDVVFDAWTGAIIRNNLLYAANNVRIEETDRTLREQIGAFPLNETHPLYKELKDGFPKGYVLTNFSHSDMQSSTVSIGKNEIFSFSLILIGNLSEYKSYFFQAIRQMCERGIGKPPTPFLLLDISEQSLSGGESQIMAVAQTDLSEQLRYPVRLTDFISDNEPDEFSEITVRYITPVIFFRLKNKKNTQLSYQDKCNRFPSFYQLARSTFFRLQKLCAVYVPDEEYDPALFDSELSVAYFEKAGHIRLQSANIRYVMLKNTQKKEKPNEMPLAGYTGEQVYSGYIRGYITLLRFMEELGVGNETVYGMGKYEVENGDDPSKERQRHKKVSTLIIRFKNEIEYAEISKFRNGIMNMLTDTGRQTEEERRHSYPLIQYKRLNGKASIICVEEGTENIGNFFSNIRDNQELSLELDTVNAYKILVQTWNSTFTYSIRKWYPFNKINYGEFRQIDDRKAKIAFLEELLIDNILSFAKGTGIRFEQELNCSIIDMEIKEAIKHNSVNIASFDLLFKTNVSLPNYIGLGKGVSRGFGTIVQMNNNENKI
jgi:hypothetical protein